MSYVFKMVHVTIRWCVGVLLSTSLQEGRRLSLSDNKSVTIHRVIFLCFLFLILF